MMLVSSIYIERHRPHCQCFRAFPFGHDPGNGIRVIACKFAVSAPTTPTAAETKTLRKMSARFYLAGSPEPIPPPLKVIDESESAYADKQPRTDPTAIETRT